jgi:hypothetical protein
MRDIELQLAGNKNLHVDLFGFSRGAAQCIELARALEERGVTVRFMGLYDPVYSLDKPGQDSSLIHPSLKSAAKNYVAAEVSANVRNTAVLYAEHEERSWFPATALFARAGGGRIHAGTAPGVHSDVGGHRKSNQYFMYLARRWMTEEAAAAGVAIEGAGEFAGPLSLRPSGYSTQRNLHVTNYAKTVPIAVGILFGPVGIAAGVVMGANQPWESQFKRDLSQKFFGEPIVPELSMQLKDKHPKWNGNGWQRE